MIRRPALLLSAMVLFALIAGCDEDATDDPGPGESEHAAEADAEAAPDAEEEAPPRVTYTTSADGLFDAHGREVLLRGVNFPSRENTAADYARVAGWGHNVVRQLYFWAHVEPTEGEYDLDFVEQLAGQVALAKQHDVLVLLDEHQHSYGVGFLWGFPEWTCDAELYERCEEPCDYFDPEVQECFQRFWNSPELRQQYYDHLVLLAERFKDEPTVIGIDVINEPFCGHQPLVGCGDVLSEFFEEAAAAIHAVAPHWLIFYEPNYIVYAGLPASLSPPTYDGGVYAAHYYLMHVHDGGDYVNDPTPIRRDIEMRGREAREFGSPLFVGEFGGMASVENFDQYIDDHMDLFDEYQAGAAYWLYAKGDGFHTMDPDGNEKPFLDQLVRPYPRLTPGAITTLSYDRETRGMQLVFAGDGSIGAPGDLFVPDRHYPDGFTVTGCDAPDCTWEHEADRQRILFTVTASREYTLTLSPP